MAHMMIDIETLSTGIDALVLAIGVVPFDEKTVYRHAGLHVSLNWQEQLDLGRNVNESTLRFWLSQPEKAREGILSGTGQKIKPALGKISKVFEKYLDSDSGVWAKGPDFDVSIIRSLFKSVKTIIPWKHWQPKDVRTALMYGPANEVKEPKGHIKHNALSDAIFQAMQVKKFLEFINETANEDEDLI